MNAPWMELLEKFVPGEIAGCPLQAMLYNSTNSNRRDMSIFVFADHRQRPSWVIRCHSDQEITTREFTALHQLAQAHCDCQPEVIGAADLEDLHALLLRFCEGRHISREMLLESKVTLDSVISVLAHVHTTLAPYANTDKTIQIEMITRQLLAFRERLNFDPHDFLSHVENSLRLVQYYTLPSLPQHGDFAWMNLLQHHGHVVILDWEHFSLVTTPFFDIWTLILSLLQDFSVESFGQLFHSTHLSRLAVYALKSYARLINLPFHAAREVLPLVLADFFTLNAQQKRMPLACKLVRLMQYYLSDADSFLLDINDKRN
jgi:aminoglycoside phosphotransferase (APT) family kinase protein